MDDILKNKRVTFLGRYSDVDFYRYTPSLFKPYYMDYPAEDHPNYEGRLVHKIRMMMEYLRGGYEVIYMVVDGKVVGHLVIANGGRRLAISEKEDIVLGPIFVSPDWRGKGIGTIGIRTVLHDLDIPYRYAYEFIKDGNIASIRTVEKKRISVCLSRRRKGPSEKSYHLPRGELYRIPLYEEPMRAAQSAS